MTFASLPSHTTLKSWLKEVFTCRIKPLVAILRADHGPEFDEEGNVKPITVDLGGMVSLLSTGDHLEHNYEFQSPVRAVEEAELFGERFYALQITTSRDSDSSVRLLPSNPF